MVPVISGPVHFNFSFIVWFLFFPALSLVLDKTSGAAKWDETVTLRRWCHCDERRWQRGIGSCHKRKEGWKSWLSRGSSTLHIGCPRQGGLDYLHSARCIKKTQHHYGTVFSSGRRNGTIKSRATFYKTQKQAQEQHMHAVTGLCNHNGCFFRWL